MQCSFWKKIVPNEAAWIIQHRETAEVLGVGGLNPHEASGKVELGYWIGENYWCNGFATEASEAILEYALSSLPTRGNLWLLCWQCTVRIRTEKAWVQDHPHLHAIMFGTSKGTHASRYGTHA